MLGDRRSARRSAQYKTEMAQLDIPLTPSSPLPHQAAKILGDAALRVQYDAELIQLLIPLNPASSPLPLFRLPTFWATLRGAHNTRRS